MASVKHRNRSGRKVTAADRKYAADLRLWIFNALAESLDRQFPSRIAGLIARDASIAAEQRYLSLAGDKGA